jgi:alkylation response protein AidB-like acyl-CoA dehydrogenase
VKLKLDPDLEAFREEVRTFLRETLPKDIIRRTRVGMHPPDEGERRWWNRVLYDKGWAAPDWPVEYGGTGWSHHQSLVFEHECRQFGAPELRWQGLRLIGPVIYTFASDAQKKRYLDPILRGEEMWAQGFSEPGAGSDLASLRTSAVLDGDHYVVNGQKVWTSEGQHCEQGFFLVRTDPTVKPQKGISMLVTPMDAPGITVRETKLINGSCGCCEVFLDNVRVPRENLIGQPGDGWTQAKFLLSNERTSSAELPKAMLDLSRVREVAGQQIKNGRPLIEDRQFALKLAQLEAEVGALEWAVLRVMHNAPSRYSIDARASVLKVVGSELQHKIADLAVEALGQDSLREFVAPEAFDLSDPEDARWPDIARGVSGDLLYMRASTIFGGAREVQKNILAKIAFGL